MFQNKAKERIIMKKLISVLISCFLMLSTMPLSVLAQEEKTPTLSGDYAPGEAIVCMEGTAARSRSALPDALTKAEVLMDLSQSSPRTRSAEPQNDAVLALVRDSGKTTEALIKELEAYPQVLFAEPNYTIEAINDTEKQAENPDASKADSTAPAENTAPQSAAKAITQPATAGPNASSQPLPDMTGYQWAYNNTGDYFSSLKNFDMNISGWNQPAESSDQTVIAVVDTGVDDTNPDLTNKMWCRGDLPLPGGEHGISFVDPAKPEDTSDPNGHGTHCAGIIGAQWGNGGVSGASQNAKIMALRYGQTLSTVLQCYDYMQSAIQLGVSLKAMNGSFTSAASPQSLNLAVETLGKMGMISIYGSANSAADNNKTGILSSTFVNNPYAVVVDAANPYGNLSDYSCYGSRTTDVVAPGTRILSTYPLEKSAYFPEFTTDNLFYESFEDPASALKFYTNADPQKGQVAGEISSQKVYNGKNSLKLQGTHSGNTIYSAPLDLTKTEGFDAEKAYRFSMELAAESNSGAAQANISVRQKDGSFADAYGILGRDGSFCGYNSSTEQLLPENTDYAHFQLRLTLYGLNITYPNGYVEIAASDTTLFIDTLGVAPAESMLPFAYSDGTSMATPAVTGAAAILSERYPDDSAAMRAARIIGSTQKYEQFTGKCVSDGFVDLGLAADPYPVVNTAKAEDNAVIIEGYFFGDSPTVHLGSTAVQILKKETTADSKTRLTVSRPQNLSGMTKVSVTSKKGEGHQIYDFGPIQNTTYFDNTLPLPDSPDFYSADQYQLVPYGDAIYCIPQSFTFADILDKLWRFSLQTKTWDTLALPQGVTLRSSSAAVFKNKLLLCNWDSYTLFTFDGKDWQTLEGEIPQLPYLSTLVVDQDQLYTVGGFDLTTQALTTVINKVDLDTKTLTPAGNTNRAAFFPLVSLHKDELIVSSGRTLNNQNGVLSGAEHLTKDENNIYQSEVLSLKGIDSGNLSGFASAAVKDGFMLSGPKTSDAKADTYTLTQKSELSPYQKLADNAPLVSPTATAYKGQYYLLARTYTTENNYVFKSTAVETDDPIKPTPDPVKPTPSPLNPTPANPDTPTTPNTSTGLNTPTQTPLALVLLILSLGAVVVFRRRRKEN